MSQKKFLPLLEKKLIDINTKVSNAQEIVHNPEISDHWHDSIMPQSFGVEPTRGWGFSHIERPLGVADVDVWDWAGVQGSWYGSYAFLEYVSFFLPPASLCIPHFDPSDKKRQRDADLTYLE